MRFSGMRDRRLRKGSRPPSFRIQTEYDHQTTEQYFQVSVNVIEARQLVWSNPQSANSFVIVILGRKKHRTTLRKNMEDPVYREYLIFDLHMSIEDVQRACIWIAVMEPRCCSSPRVMGEATIDLGAVWAQSNHQIYHKWAQLNQPRDTATTGPVGFLKVDISIILRGEMRVIPSISNEKTDDSILMGSGFEQQKANYIVTIYAAFGLPSSMQSNSDRKYGKPPSTYVRVTFCGLVSKSTVQHQTSDPKYNEQISIVEMFPNMNPTIKFEVCLAEGYFNRVLASTDLHLVQISYDGENGFLPTFGPSLLHMYGPTSGSTAAGAISSDYGPFHKGALLASIRTIVPYYEVALKAVTADTVAPIQPDSLWVQGEFNIYCPIFEISMLDRHLIGTSSGIAITMGEIPTDKKPDPEFLTMTNELKHHKLYYTGSLDVIKTKDIGCVEFASEYPVLQLATRQPDFRFRMYRNNIVHGIVNDLEKALSDVERRLNQLDYTAPSELIDDLSKAVDDTTANILKFLDIIQYSSNTTNCEEPLEQYTTELDQKLLALQREEIEKIYNQITRKAKEESISSIFQQSSKIGTKESLMGSKKGAKYMLAEVKTLTQNLKNTIYKSVDGWPDITIWLLNERGSRVAYKKLSAADVIYSVIPEQCGRFCGRIQTIYLKPLKCSKHMNPVKCYCIAAKVEVMFWMGLFRQRYAFGNFIPEGYRLKTKHFDLHVKSNPMMIECRAFIYRAKFANACGIHGSNVCNSFVRINALGNAADSKIQHKTSLPTYNQVLRIQKLINTSAERLNKYPPQILIEVYDDNLSHKTEFVGRLEIQPVIDDRPDYAPKLQWYDIFRGPQLTGQILMSVQILQLPEKLIKTTLYSPVHESYTATCNNMSLETEQYEPLPRYLIPKSMSFKVDVYWWGLRDVNIIRKPCVVLEIDDLVIKSEIIVDKKCNSNFPNGRISEIFESPLTQDYSPTLNIRLFDSSTFGRTLFLGTNVIKNPSKFLMEWLSKDERDASLKSVSIVSSDFHEVDGHMLFVKKSKSDGCEQFVSNYSLKCVSTWRQSTKKNKWSRLFCRKEPDEEEMTLLPVYAKENDLIKVVKKIPKPVECNDWWMRYFHSEKQPYCEEDRMYSDYITIYDYELEFQPEFSKFKDWCSTLKLYSGKKSGIPEKDEQLQCGSIKAGIAIYRWPPPNDIVAVSVNGVELEKGYFEEHPSNDPSKYLVRVYVVKACLPKEYIGKTHPYVLINCGKKQVGDRKNFVANTAEPIFGKMYEFSCSFPDDYLLTVSLYDCDPVPPDELIGSSIIDLEDRVYSKHRACVGLASEYNLKGPSRWRDSVKPSTILEDVCARNHISPPLFPDTYTVVVNGVEYKDSGLVRSTEKCYATAAERKENICLSILHRWHTFPICGYQLVPEHVETRSLCHPEKPGIERGKLQMWVDIFPLDSTYHIPPPYDVTPKKIEEYQLRVIVWDVQSVLVTQERKKLWKTADLYVKMWVGTTDNAQQTDVHFSTTSGVGNFNWRMIFNFLYHPAERKLVNREMCPFTEYEEYLSPLLEVQLLESNEDEFLGSQTLNLNSMYRGAKQAQQCTLAEMETGKRINLFSLRSIRAWWPLKTGDAILGNEAIAGFIDMEMTLLPLETAVLMPVGVGRDPPFPLPEPSRPESSKSRYSKYCCSLYECFSIRGKELLTFFVIVSGVWFLAYLLCLVLPSTESFDLFTKFYRRSQKNVQGIIRPLYP